jgi:23S rRNA pseudouridine2605 synthase
MTQRRFKSRSRGDSPRVKRGTRRGGSANAGEAGVPRLQKVLAAAGLGSRRECEQLIVEGRVEVDRRVVNKLGTRVEPHGHEIRVDGEPLSRPKVQYFMLNKPPGVVSTARDPAGRPRVIDLIHTGQRLFPVGRLDLSSEGLILVTNDGELANLLTHPRYEVEKTYLAEVAGVPSREALAQLERGVHLAEGFAHAKRARIKTQRRHSAVLEVVLDEGRNREVRRLLARAGHKVLRLKRIAIGALRLGDLAPGEYRPLRSEEVSGLKQGALTVRKRPIQPVKREAKFETPRAVPQVPIADSVEDQQLLPDQIDVLEIPRRKGTIIGAEDVAQSESGSQLPVRDERRSTTAKRPSAVIKPLIDVRRGIFPRLRDQADDDDQDQPTKSTSFREGDFAEVGTAQGSQHGSKRPRQQRKVTNRPRAHGTGKAGKRRDARPAPPADRPSKGRRSARQTTQHVNDAHSKHGSRRKGRRR